MPICLASRRRSTIEIPNVPAVLIPKRAIPSTFAGDARDFNSRITSSADGAMSLFCAHPDRSTESGMGRDHIRGGDLYRPAILAVDSRHTHGPIRMHRLQE